MRIKSIQGDITDIETDALVNSANTEMVLGGRHSVAGRINQLTEGRLEHQLQDPHRFPRPIPLGSVYVTDGDVLPCQYVFHLAAHGPLGDMLAAAEKMEGDEDVLLKLGSVLLQSIQLGVKNILEECERHQIARLSLPLIGTGTLNLTKALAIEVLVGALAVNLSEKSLPELEEILIVSYDEVPHQQLTDYLDQSKLFETDREEAALQRISVHMSEPVPEWGVEEPDSCLVVSSSLADAQESSLAPHEAIGELADLKRRIRDLEGENAGLDANAKQATEEMNTLLKENRDLKKKLKEFHREQFRDEGWQRLDLPLPLAYAQNLRVSEEDPNRRRLNAMTAIGIASKYFSAIVCAEYQAAGNFDQALNQELSNRFGSGPMTDGSWHWVGTKIARAFRNQGMQGQVLQELPGLWVNDRGNWTLFSEKLKALVNLRNQIHNPVNADPAPAREWLNTMEPLWEEMCELSRDLLNYELVYIDSIQDFLPGTRIRYSVKHLRGGYFVPQSATLDLVEQHRPEHLFLRERDSDVLLGLHPFMVYEYSSVTNNREAYCLDCIQSAQFQFRAFRYAHNHHLNHLGDLPF